LYINDFVLINCSINSNKDLILIKNLISQILLNNVELVYKNDLKFALPIIHYLFNEIKQEISYYLKYSKFEPSINNVFNSKQQDIHLNAALETVKIFRKNKIDYFFDSFNQKQAQLNLNKLCSLIQLINQTLTINLSETKLVSIQQEYESLSLLLLFVDNMTFNDSNNLKLLNELKNTLIDSFKQNVNFKTRTTVEQLQDFIVVATQKLLNQFNSKEVEENLNVFYFNAIEYLVFMNQSAPNDDTIDLILETITSKHLSGGGGVAFTIEPTFRKLLIQIIFKNYNQKVISHLEKWFREEGNITGARSLFESSNELALLFQDCVHDQLIHDLTTKNQTLKDQIDLANKECEYLLKKNQLNQIFKRKKMYGATYEVTFLIDLAKLKFCLCTMSKSCHSKDLFDLHNKDLTNFNKNLKELIHNTFGQSNEEHSQYGKTDTFINYLIKDMIRKYGSSSVKYILAEQELNWMAPGSIIGNQEYVNDKYVLCPFQIYLKEEDKSYNKYLAYKKAIHECFEEKNLNPIEKLNAKFTNQSNSQEHLAYLGIALYQNVTLLYKSIETSTSQIVEYFEPLSNQFKTLLDNSFSHYLKVNKTNWNHIDLSLLLIQIKFCVLFAPKEDNLLACFRDLLLNPISFAEKYLPTMSQDSVYDVKTVLADTALYKCPNGHTYAIGGKFNSGKKKLFLN
jgi:hypothetical protein